MQERTDIWLTYGLPASGKSTWAKRMVAQSDGEVVRVNMDDIRSMLGIPYSKAAEELALKVQDQAILSAIAGGKKVIVDNTHIEMKMPKRIKRLFDGEVYFGVKDFSDVTTAECILRDTARKNKGERSVGAEVIRKMAGRMARGTGPLMADWMNDITLSDPYVPVPGSPRAILVDIDGTLARHDSRSPYDYTRVLTDGVHMHIDDLVTMYSNQGYRIILLSGRPDIDNVRRDTEQWLKEKGIPFDYLFMRPADRLQDNDADIKQDLFDEHIRRQYHVDLMLDDRNRVVRRMRKLAIPVLQVANGDF